MGGAKRPSSHDLYSDVPIPSKSLLSLTPSRWLVFPIIFTQMLNYGIIRPSIPTIELEFFSDSYAMSSLVGGVADALGALLSFMLMPMLGGYSDVHGRKVVLLLTLLLNSLPVMMLCLYPRYLSLWWFFGMQVVAKLSTFSSVYAYLADITVREKRGEAYAQMSGMVFLALTIGPAISAVSSMQGSFLIAAFLSLLNLLYCAFVMPESLPALVYRPLDAASSPLTSPPPPAQRLTPFSTLTFMFRSRLYLLIFGMVLLEQLAVYGIGEIFLLYLMNSLGFRRRDNIHLGIAQGVASILVMLVLLPLLSPRLGEKRVIILSLCLYLLYTALYPFVTTRGQVYSLITLSSLSTMSYPATSSLLSIHSPSSEQGLSQGALSGIRSLALGVGPLLFALVFAFFTRDDAEHQRPWVPFILAAALTSMSLVVAWKLPEQGEEEKGGGRPGAQDGEAEEGEEDAELGWQQQKAGGYGAVSKRDGLYDDVDDMKELDERRDATRPLRH